MEKVTMDTIKVDSLRQDRESKVMENEGDRSIKVKS